MKNNTRYELRLRQNPYGYSKNSRTQKPKKNKKDNFMNKSIVSVIALICVMLMKMSTSETAVSGLETLKTLLEKQIDYQAVGEVAMEQLNAVLDEVEFFRQTQTANSETVTLKAPLREGIITQGFEKGTHPLLSTQTQPEGITITTEKGAFVLCASDGVISAKTENADGTYKVFLSAKDNPNLSIVYDGLVVCYFDINDNVAASQILGMLPSRESESVSNLKFCVYLNNEATNPTLYLGDIYPDETK